MMVKLDKALPKDLRILQAAEKIFSAAWRMRKSLGNALSSFTLIPPSLENTVPSIFIIIAYLSLKYQ